MKRHLLFITLVLIGQFVIPSIGKAAVTPIQGSVDPEVSTDVVPKWYTIMSSHLTALDRQNRFLVWDGTRLKTEKFDSGIPENQLEDKYLWRLEQGSADNKVYIVNRTGLRVYAPTGANPTNNTALTVSVEGVEWELKLTSETGQSDCAEKQYCFNFLGAESSPAYLNAMDAQNNGENTYGITLYNMGVHQASGWFFYEANVPEGAKYTIKFNEPENGTVQILNAQNEEITSNTQLIEGTEIHINITPAEHYEIASILFNNEEQKENFTEEKGTYSYVTTISEDLDIAVLFRLLKYTVNFEVTPVASGSLTIKNGDVMVQNGAEVEYGTELIGTLTYEDTFKVKALTINGVDCLDDIVDKAFTFAVTEAIDIYVEFESKPSGVENNPSTDVSIPATFTGNLTISNVALGDYVSLYNITGQLISSETAQDSRATLDTADMSSGCYIVQIRHAGKIITRKTIKR